MYLICNVALSPALTDAGASSTLTQVCPGSISLKASASISVVKSLFDLGSTLLAQIPNVFTKGLLPDKYEMLSSISKDSSWPTRATFPFSTYMLAVEHYQWISNDRLIGNSDRFPTPATEPQGAVLSMAADHTLSAGHINAAGPISSVPPKSVAAWADRAITARPRNKALKGVMLSSIGETTSAECETQPSRLEEVR